MALLSGPDATAVLAASTAPNGGWLGERKQAYQQALEAAQRHRAVTPCGAGAFRGGWGDLSLWLLLAVIVLGSKVWFLAIDPPKAKPIGLYYAFDDDSVHFLSITQERPRP